MTELILVRHGQTAWNVVEVFRGRSDIDLDETGFRQAELLADYLSERRIEAVYSSPLKRALKTARAIATKHGLKVIATESLNDLKFGEWEGLPVTEVREKYPTLFTEWVEKPHLVEIPGGEGLDDVKQRVLNFVNDLVTRHKGTVVLVSHRVVHKVLTLALLGVDNSYFWNIKLDTAAMSTFAYENNRWVLTEHNNTSYLRPLMQPKLKDF
ncbi:MAG TPA: histidine phosphatase family protein [Dehalococcoidales bacterium]